MGLSQGQLQPVTNPSQALANGIATAEGYGTPGAIPTVANNPGDLKLGDIGYGVQSNGITNFPDSDAGFAALNNQVQLIQNGTSKAGYTTDMSVSEVAQLYTGGDNPSGWASTVTKTYNGYNLGNPISTDSNFSQTGQGVVTPDGTAPPISGTSPTAPSFQGNQANPLSDLKPEDYVPVAGSQISATDIAALTPSVVIQPSVVDGNPWYSDKELIHSHVSLDASVPSPITFQIQLPSSAQQGSTISYLSDSQNNPIVIELNVSAKSLNTQSKHIFHRTPTRTGMHVTFWGMQPDLITGDGTTGAFYNQFGLSSFMSTSSFSGAIQQQILNLLNQSKPVADQTVQTGLTSEALRVAAQDAFQEFLMLFKENGVVYFHPKSYKGFLNGTDQSSPTAWSPSTGTSLAEMNGRNNDVMARGHVVMKFKSSIYLGYFKSFNWTMDANTPFQWTFSFVFQVEKTLSLVYFPQSAGA